MTDEQRMSLLSAISYYGFVCAAPAGSQEQRARDLEEKARAWRQVVALVDAIPGEAREEPTHDR